ncbi:MAG: SGNH family hydrolase, partial [Salaquimonas sp.]
LELLFGGAARKNRERKEAAKAAKAAKTTNRQAKVVRVKRSKTKKSNTSSSIIASAAAANQIAAVEKSEDAAKVLVIGDFMADQLSQGLERVFAANPGIVIVNSSVALSGMVRDDVKNWPESIDSLIDQEKPIVVVALVGMNDRQQIRVAEGKFNKLTDGWMTVYEKRADILARNIREKRVPMIWVGLPPVDKTNMSSDYIRFNEIYRKTVEAYGGIFVDVWDGFVDTEGRYFRSGPDVNGQIVRLRRADGINMTDSGEDKLAFYAEKAVKKMTGFSKDALVSSLGSLSDFGVSNEPQYDPIGTGKTIVVALGGPAADGGSVLEGAEGFLNETQAKQSSSFELVAKGLASQPKKGRIDAAWGVPSFSLARDETPEPVLANMRGISLKGFLDELPPLADDGSSVSSEQAGSATVSN